MGTVLRSTSRERTAASRDVSDRFAAARSYLNGKTDLQAWQRGVCNARVACQRFQRTAGARRRDARARSPSRVTLMQSLAGLVAAQSCFFAGEAVFWVLFANAHV